MPITITISGAQRQVLRELVLDHLSALGDLNLALGRGDHATAERLGAEFAGDLRLMADLGWSGDWRESADLTMAYSDLAPLLQRLREEAEGGLAESTEDREARRAEEEVRERRRYARETCAGLLMLIDELEGNE